MFSVVCLFVSNITQSFEWLAMKFYGGVRGSTRKNWLNFGGNAGLLRWVNKKKTHKSCGMPWSSLCCLVTPGLSKGILCHVWPYFFYKQVQISRSDVRPHIKWAVSLVILHMVTSMSLQGLCGYIWVNILTLSPQRVALIKAQVMIQNLSQSPYIH